MGVIKSQNLFFSRDWIKIGRQFGMNIIICRMFAGNRKNVAITLD